LTTPKKPPLKELDHTLFQGKRLSLEQAMEQKNDLTLNKPFLEETHHNLSSLSLRTLIECSAWRKEAKTFSSQLCAFYKHLGEFLEICSTIEMHNFSEDALKMRLYPFHSKIKPNIGLIPWKLTRSLRGLKCNKSSLRSISS